MKTKPRLSSFFDRFRFLAAAWGARNNNRTFGDGLFWSAFTLYLRTRRHLRRVRHERAYDAYTYVYVYNNKSLGVFVKKNKIKSLSKNRVAAATDRLARTYAYAQSRRVPPNFHFFPRKRHCRRPRPVRSCVCGQYFTAAVSKMRVFRGPRSRRFSRRFSVFFSRFFQARIFPACRHAGEFGAQRGSAAST